MRHGYFRGACPLSSATTESSSTSLENKSLRWARSLSSSSPLRRKRPCVTTIPTPCGGGGGISSGTRRERRALRQRRCQSSANVPRNAYPPSLLAVHRVHRREATFHAAPKVLCPNGHGLLKPGRTSITFQHAPHREPRTSSRGMGLSDMWGEAYVPGEIAREAYRRAVMHLKAKENLRCPGGPPGGSSLLYCLQGAGVGRLSVLNVHFLRIKCCLPRLLGRLGSSWPVFGSSARSGVFVLTALRERRTWGMPVSQHTSACVMPLASRRWRSMSASEAGSTGW